jgi:hypothetical protein
MKRLALFGLAAALLSLGYAVPATSVVDKPAPPVVTSLHAAWKAVEGRYGVLKDDPRGPVLAVSLQGQTGSVLVESVGSDCVMLGGDGNTPGWHTIFPLDRLELQVYR